jgi:phosphoserine phosphatase RsbU/P
MVTVSTDFFREQLEVRRKRLAGAMQRAESNAELSGLLQEVDLALERVEKGTFGICEECNYSIEADRLIADPTVRVCLDHLTSDQRRKLEDDLQLASQVQLGLLPKLPVRTDGWQIHYHYQPAGLVSGDYCDLIVSPNGNGDFIFLLGDVSGKGVAASMLMAQLHAMFRSLVSVGLPLQHLLASANHVLVQSSLTGHYATLMAGKASRSGEIELTGAGHVPALLVTERGVTPVPATGLPLGLFPSSEYGSHKLQLRPGDSLVLYTDGLSEAVDSDGTQYGEQRLSEFFADKHRKAPDALTIACLQDFAAFCASRPPVDDLTLMSIHRPA